MDNIEIDFYEAGKDVLLILTGLGGSVKGFENKYETIAKQVVKDYGFSVVVATTPYGSWEHLKENLEYVMGFIKNKRQNDDFKVYAMGTSAGANIVLCFSYLFPQIKRVLAVNPVLTVNLHWINDGIKDFVGDKIEVVVGEEDLSSQWVELLPKMDKLQTTILPNVEHYFKGHLQTYIDLPKKYLFNCKEQLNISQNQAT